MEFNFKVTEQETNIIINALAKEPYMNVFNLINKLQNQANEQVKQKEVKTE